MKKTLRNFISLILIGVLLFSAVSAGAFGFGWEDETDWQTLSKRENETDLLPVLGNNRVLYRWTASALENDVKVFSSNLISNADARLRWNESGVLYTEHGRQQVVIHSFLNEAVGSGDSAYGLPQIAGKSVENLKVDVYPQVETTDMEAVGLSFVYAYKPSENGLNPANSGLLRIYVSEDSENWSEDYVSVRSVSILGSGTAQNGEEVIYYQIDSENLMDIGTLTSGDDIQGVRIMPDGETGIAGGSFSLCKLTLTGYVKESGFEKAVPDNFLNTATSRNAMVSAARSAVEEEKTELAVIQNAISLVTDYSPASVSELLHSTQIRPLDGIATKATDEVKEIFEYLFDYKMMDPAEADLLLAEYEAIETTRDIVMDLNTPQQIFRAYAKAEAGDILLQVTDTASHGYVVVKSDPVYLSDRVNVDPLKSTITYLTLNGEKTTTFYAAYVQERIEGTDSQTIVNGFLPLTVEMLEEEMVRADGHISIADGVRVAVASNWDIERYTLSMGDFSTTVNQPGVADIYTSAELNEFVAGLEPGAYVMNAEVFTKRANETPIILDLEFEVAENVELFQIINSNMILGNSLAMNFYVEKSDIEADKEYYIQVTKDYADGRKNVVQYAQAQWQDYNNDWYRVTYDGIAAKEMSDDLHVQVFYADGTAASEVWTESVRDYAEFFLSRQTSGKWATLVVDMLNYGAAAQEYFGYNESDLANSILTEEQQALATGDVTANNNFQIGENGMFYNSNVVLESNIVLKMYFKNLEEGMYVKVSFVDHYGEEKTMIFNELEDLGAVGHMVVVDELAVADGCQVVTCEVYDADGYLRDTGSDSVESYIYSSLKLAGKEGPLCTAMLKFITSAKAGFAEG